MLNRLVVGVVNRAGTLTRLCTTQCVTQQSSLAEEEKIVSISDQRILTAAVVGTPNAGKSTLINHLIGQKVFAVTHKVQTTQRRALGVFTEGHSQVVVVDTPGIIPYQFGRKLKLSKSLRHDAYRSAFDADMIVVVVDAANKWTRVKLDPGIVRILAANEFIPSVLVLNKIDLVKHKHVLLPLTSCLTCASDISEQHSQDSKTLTNDERRLLVKNQPQDYSSDDVEDSDKGIGKKTGWPHFSKVFMVSALTGDGMDSLRDHLTSSAKHGNWQYEVSAVTGEPMLNMADDVIREKLFLYMEKEIPYAVKQETYSCEEREDGTIAICKDLICRKTSQTSILIGPGGKTIQMITHEAQNDLQRLWNRPVELTLNIKSSKQ